MPVFLKERELMGQFVFIIGCRVSSPVTHVIKDEDLCPAQWEYL